MLTNTVSIGNIRNGNWHSGKGNNVNLQRKWKSVIVIVVVTVIGISSEYGENVIWLT